MINETQLDTDACIVRQLNCERWSHANCSDGSCFLLLLLQSHANNPRINTLTSTLAVVSGF